MAGWAERRIADFGLEAQKPKRDHSVGLGAWRLRRSVYGLSDVRWACSALCRIRNRNHWWRVVDDSTPGPDTDRFPCLKLSDSHNWLDRNVKNVDPSRRLGLRHKT